MTIKHWARWKVPGEDPRPIYYPTHIEWWCTGEGDGFKIVCALVFGETEDDCLKSIRKNGWPECEGFYTFCDPVADDWRPNASRFPPKEVA